MPKGNVCSHNFCRATEDPVIQHGADDTVSILTVSESGTVSLTCTATAPSGNTNSTTVNATVAHSNVFCLYYPYYYHYYHYLQPSSFDL